MTKQTFTTGQVLTAAQMTSLQQTAMGGGSTTAKVASYTLVAADAGTVVQMNAAGATTITVNQNLFSAGDTLQIQNIGAGVCTVTAGSASVNTAGSLALSQYEGGQLYFNTASAALFFDIVQSSGMTNPLTTTGDIIYSSSGSTPARLGIGTTGQVVTVASGLPSWATPAGGSFNTGYDLTVGAQSTTSTSYTDLATVTATTVTTGTKALVSWSVHCENNSINSSELQSSFAVSGATTLAASDDYSTVAFLATTSPNFQVTVGRSFVLSGLTAGSNTFTIKYKNNAGNNTTYRRRLISVVNLGS